MLVLSRRPGQKVFIAGDKISVEVLKVVGKHVTLGFTAPDGISIMREELLSPSEEEDGREAFAKTIDPKCEDKNCRCQTGDYEHKLGYYKEFKKDGTDDGEHDDGGA